MTAHVPTRAELYAAVDGRFRTEHPDAPVRLSPDLPEHAHLRARWLELRDEWLNAEVDRVYSESYPGAPAEIDPDDPGHASYVEAWRQIRDQIMSDPPEPEDGPSVSEMVVEKTLDDQSTSLGHDWIEERGANPDRSSDDETSWP